MQTKTQEYQELDTKIPDALTLTEIEVTQQDIDKAYKECNEPNENRAKQCVISQSLKRVFNPDGVVTITTSSSLVFGYSVYGISFKNSKEYIHYFDQSIS